MSSHSEAERQAAHLARRGPNKRKPKPQSPTKQEKFRAAVGKYKSSSRGYEDLLDLIMVSSACLRPADGLAWSEIQDILRSELGG